MHHWHKIQFFAYVQNHLYALTRLGTGHATAAGCPSLDNQTLGAALPTSLASALACCSFYLAPNAADADDGLRETPSS